MGAKLVTAERARFEQRIGSVIGGYVIDDVVGSGGMGVVYRARQGETGRVVAVKLMLPEVASNRKFRERFILEAQVAPELDHPHIVPVFEVGDSAGELFIAMRLVEGLDLKVLIEQDGPVKAARALRLLRQAANAVDYAHERGVVHRDVKPQNFLVTKVEDHDHLYLTDFGLVKPTSTESNASRTTDVFGSIQYMSPEQIEDLPADGRADVYSLACVLFECLTGKPPFERSNEVAVLWAHVHEEPPRVTDLQSSIPSGLDLVLRQAMSKHPDDRYLTCGEFVDALEEAAKQQRRELVAPLMRPLVKRVPRPKTEREVWAPNYFPELSRVRKLTDRTNWVHVAAITAVLAVLAAAVVHFAHPRGITGAVAEGAGAVTRTLETAGEAIGSVLRPSASDSPTTSLASGRSRRSAVSGGEGDTTDRARAAPARELGTRGLPGGPSGAGLGASSKAREFIAFASDRSGSYDIWVVEPGDRVPRQLTRGGAVDLAPAISPDGQRILFSRQFAARGTCMSVIGHRECVGNVGHLWVMNSDGSDLRQLTTGTNTYDSEPDWAPDGQSIVFTRWESARNPKLYVMDLDEGVAGNARLLIASNDGEMEASFSPDGRRVVYSGFRDDDGTWEPQDDHSTELGIVELSVGANGYVVLSVHDPNIGGGGEAAPAWAPNGRDIVFTRPSGLWIWECAVGSCTGSNAARARPLTDGRGWGSTWSPDGSQIAFQRCQGEEKCRILAMDLNDSRVRTLIDHPGAFDVLPDWGEIK